MKPVSPLPDKQGLPASFLWLPQEEWPGLLSFLVVRFPGVPAAVWQERMLRGEVCNARGERFFPDSPYRAGECLFYYREVAAEPRIPFDEVILFQDAHLLVVDKPHFLPVIPTGRFVRETLLVRLREKTGLHDLVPIHRLDRETAGVMLFSISPDSRGQYQQLFRERRVHKIYEAVAPVTALSLPLIYESRLERAERFFLTAEVAGVPNATTRVELIRQSGTHALYRLFPVSGKKHQLRVHMNALGMPIMHDNFYPVAVPDGTPDNFDAPLKLLARSIAFEDPVTGQERFFESQQHLLDA